MHDTKSFASLSPTLLARKGGAKPAMRRQLQPLHQFHEATARQLDDDLGWNDMGHDGPDGHAGLTPLQGSAEVEPIAGDAEAASVVSIALKRVSQQASTSDHIATPPRQSQPAVAQERCKAFTLRLDAERHLKLRLASTIENRSAQQLLTEALDSVLNEIPGLDDLVSRITRH